MSADSTGLFDLWRPGRAVGLAERDFPSCVSTDSGPAPPSSASKWAEGPRASVCSVFAK